MTLFDLTVLPLSPETGRDQSDLPGLLVASAPRKATRLRAQDTLVLYLALSGYPSAGANPLTPTEQQEMLSRLAEKYFTASGSITAALRVVVSSLNDLLLNRNLRHAREGQLVGALSMGALHGTTLLLAHTGTAHTFVISKAQVQHFDDSQSGRGLGLSRQVVPRFYQTTLESGDILLFCSEPPVSWNARTLAGATQLGLEYLRRRLLSQSANRLQAAVVKLQTGKGQIQWHHPSHSEHGAVTPSTPVVGTAPAEPLSPYPQTSTEHEPPLVSIPSNAESPAQPEDAVGAERDEAGIFPWEQTSKELLRLSILSRNRSSP